MKSLADNKKQSSIGNLQRLLESYSIVPVGQNKPPTLMEIAGFPHWENVYSNILAFFLDTQGVHCFGALFIQSLLAAYKNNCPEKWPGADLKFENISGTENVEREVTTETGKRIDIVVECSKLVVCIENKIWAELHNNLDEYRKHCENDNKEKEILGIVLSPDKHNEDQLSKHQFVNIIYADLVKELSSRLGFYIAPHNTQYHYLLLDFLEQANQFKEENIMNEDQQEFLKLWKIKEKEINNIQSKCDELKNFLGKGKIQKHNDECRNQLKKLNPSYNVLFTDGVWKHHTAVFDLDDSYEIKDCRVFLDVEFHPLRISYQLSSRRKRDKDVPLLAKKVSEKSGLPLRQYNCYGEKSDRYEFNDEESPLYDNVFNNAVKNSFKILRALAELYYEEQNTG